MKALISVFLLNLVVSSLCELMWPFHSSVWWTKQPFHLAARHNFPFFPPAGAAFIFELRLLWEKFSSAVRHHGCRHPLNLTPHFCTVFILLLLGFLLSVWLVNICSSANRTVDHHISTFPVWVIPLGRLRTVLNLKLWGENLTIEAVFLDPHFIRTHSMNCLHGSMLSLRPEVIIWLHELMSWMCSRRNFIWLLVWPRGKSSTDRIFVLIYHQL